MNKKKKFIDRLTEYAEKSLKPPGRTKRMARCVKFTGEDYVKYVNEQMSPEESKIFENHSWDCPACLASLVEQENSMQPIEDSTSNVLLHKTLKYLDDLDRKSGTNYLATVIKMGKNAIEVIRTTGMILGQPSPVPVRGQKKQPETIKPLRVIDNLEKLHISIQTTFEMMHGQDTTLTISLLDTDTDKFMGEVDIKLCGPGFEEKKKSDRKGKASFLLGCTGSYLATIGPETQKIATLEVSVINSDD